MQRFLFLLVALLVVSVLETPAYATRIKDIASIDGVRPNQLIGFGLVGGLLGTGDDPKNAIYTPEAISGMLSQFGFHVAPETIKLKNFAAVAVTVDMPAFIRSGDRLDVTVSSIGSAKSIEGGILYRTLIYGHDNNIYAVAQGPVSLGDFVGQSTGGGAKKHTTVGRVVGGAIVEREIPSTVLKEDGTIRINLHRPDYTTAQNITAKLQKIYGPGAAMAADAGSVAVRVPEYFRYDLVPFIAAIESFEIEGDAPAKVVINQRTGTIVLGGDVQILPIAVAHGSLSISVGRAGAVSAGGGAVELPEAENQSARDVDGPKESFVRVNAKDVVSGLNKLGVAPRDIVAIFEAMSAAGALMGTLEVI